MEPVNCKCELVAGGHDCGYDYDYDYDYGYGCDYGVPGVYLCI
jgi:hypothetical protein